MKRDMDFQHDFNAKMADENRQLVDDIDALKRHLDMKDKEQNILKMQIKGLQEDNERIARMYQLVQTVSQNKRIDDEKATATKDYLEAKRRDEKEQA